MLGMLLLLVGSPQEPRLLMEAAGAKLSAACTGAACAEPPARSRYRVEPSADLSPSAKDRALAVDGTYCNVAGARRCTKKPRTIFRTDFTR